MISSAPKLKVLVELVTKASITESSRPELASLITSDTGLLGLIDAGSGFSFETSLAGASVSASTAVCSVASAEDAGVEVDRFAETARAVVSLGTVSAIAGIAALRGRKIVKL